MAKAKNSKKQSKGAGNGVKRVRAAGGASTPADDGGALIRRLMAKYPEPTPAEVRAFTKQCGTPAAAALGARTRAINVLHDAERFASTMQAPIATPKGGLIYGTARFRFFLGAIDSLRAAIDEDRRRLADAASVKSGAETARREAMAAREGIVERLAAFAEGNAARGARLSKALLDTKTDDLLIASLIELAKLARTWLASNNEDDRALANSLRLDEASVASVETARAKLAGAHGDNLDAGKTVARDSAATNTIEGRVLFEMRFAMRLFDAAHRRDARVPRLVPGAGTRHVLAPQHAPSAAADTPTPEAAAAG